MASDVPQGTGRNAVVPPPVECMLPATPDSLARAKVCAPSYVLLLRRRAHLDGGVCASPQAFAREITAGGLTDILHPVQQAFGLLSEVARQRPSSFAVPVCFLMTVCTHSCKPPHAMGCSDEHDCCGCVDGVCVCVCFLFLFFVLFLRRASPIMDHPVLTCEDSAFLLFCF